MLSNLSNTSYRKSCKRIKEQNSSIVNFNSGWKLTKFIILPRKMRTSRPPSSSVSIEHWNPSCGVISLAMTRCPIWLYWTRWLMSTTAPYTAVSEWHPMTSLPEIKQASGSDSMPTPYPIKNLPSMLETQCGSARQDGRSRRDICLSGQKRSSLSWKERVHNLPHSCWRITLGKCWRALFIHRNCKSDKDGRRVSSGQNTQENKESSLDQMAGLSKQIQQLGECERSCVIFHVIILLLFLSGVLLMVFLMNEVETLSFGDDYLLVNNDINVTMKTSSSVWWRTVTVVDAHGVVQEVGFPKRKSSTPVNCYSFYPSFWLAFTTWPITKEINSSGWHYWVVVWAISYQIHPSNHEWFLSHVTK